MKAPVVRPPWIRADHDVVVDTVPMHVDVDVKLARRGVRPAESPVLTMADLIAATFQFGCACRVSAATPATCGAAIDVPDKVSAPLPEPDAVETPFCH